MKYLLLISTLLTSLFCEELININFKGLKLSELVNITSKSINKSILVTDELNGKLNFISNEPINKNKLLSILKFSLESNGYKLIETDDILRVVKNDFKTNNEFKKAQNKIIKQKPLIIKSKEIIKIKDEVSLETTEVIF